MFTILFFIELDDLLFHIPPETQLTQEQLHDSEADVIRGVCKIKDKKIQSGWVAGSGPVLKKKYRIAWAMAEASWSGPFEDNILSEQLAEVNQRLADTERRLKATKQAALE